jgi:hypothetical protein
MAPFLSEAAGQHWPLQLATPGGQTFPHVPFLASAHELPDGQQTSPQACPLGQQWPLTQTLVPDWQHVEPQAILRPQQSPAAFNAPMQH